KEILLLIQFILIIVIGFYLFDLYNPWVHYSNIPLQYRSLLGIFLIPILYISYNYILTFYMQSFFQSRTILLTSFLFIAPFIFISRFYFQKYLDPKRLKIRILVICNLEIAEKFQHEINIRGGKWQIEYLLNEIPKEMNNSQNLSIYGTIQEKFYTAIREQWTAIVVAKKDLELEKEKIQILFELKQKGVLVYDLIHFYEYYFFKIPLYYIDDYWFIQTKGFLIVESSTVMKLKRIVEVIFSLILALPILVFLPFILLIVYLSDGFPLIYKQERLGMNNKKFIAYKFRTMIKGSDKLDPYTREKDSRVTKIGNFLRKSRIDEIPQIINVIKGDISLIGPRAEWTKLTEIYQKVIPFYYYRHTIRPGLTGWAQVMYPYGASIEDTIQKLEYDLYYIKNYSFLLDISILIKTIRIVLFGRGR
ncbi:MAG: exopolysaccharide biosynthesis polyprenyl glycosylphosphotransferase, partial [Leptospiraceae bacterium]|nr:exopolysaccharide biosynthesis polyprenyl glycosylphosphotransferase [Leptospiraceae bacterium]MDW7976930.1 exopolysaccharide biosynthesis polyprenyl glycosylphosphotransferase [Leptospiraceae bacterium]